MFLVTEIILCLLVTSKWQLTWPGQIEYFQFWWCFVPSIFFWKFSRRRVMVPTINRARNMSGQTVFIFRKNTYIRPNTMFEICPEAICQMMVHFVLPVSRLCCNLVCTVSYWCATCQLSLKLSGLKGQEWKVVDHSPYDIQISCMHLVHFLTKASPSDVIGQ